MEWTCVIDLRLASIMLHLTSAVQFKYQMNSLHSHRWPDEFSTMSNPLRWMAQAHTDIDNEICICWSMWNTLLLSMPFAILPFRNEHPFDGPFSANIHIILQKCHNALFTIIANWFICLIYNASIIRLHICYGLHDPWLTVRLNWANTLQHEV